MADDKRAPPNAVDDFARHTRREYWLARTDGADPHEIAGALMALAVDAMRFCNESPETIGRVAAAFARERAGLGAAAPNVPPAPPRAPAN